jgi:septum formation protein
MDLILASASPRRRDLLSRLGIPFRIVPSDLAEPDPQIGQDPEEYALAIAAKKARDVARNCPGTAILSGDTVVVCGAQIFGKPNDAKNAEIMLAKLSATEHSVVTAVVVRCGGGVEFSGAITSRVRMRDMTDQEIRSYVATGESIDKAGAYAIQGLGGSLIAEVVGCYDNVVGLPLCLVRELLGKCGFPAMESANLCLHSKREARGKKIRLS